MPRFADIRGQDHARTLLTSAAARGRLHHAYLFHGAPGVGKTMAALALAQLLNCEQPADTDACGACRTCRLMDGLKHPDLHWIFPMPGALKKDDRAKHIVGEIEARTQPEIYRLVYTDASSIAIGRDEDTRMGSLWELRHEAAMAPVEARVKVFVVSDAERMTDEAQNSLLKVLEEPLPGNLIVLCTAAAERLLPTTLSRCQAVRFRDLPEAEIVTLLLTRGVRDKKKRKKKDAENEPAEEPRITPEAASLAAALARGSVIRAAKLVEKRDILAARDESFALLREGSRHPEVYRKIGELAVKKSKEDRIDREPIEELLDFGFLWTGDLLRAATQSDLPLANRDREVELRREAATLTVPEIRRRVTVLQEARTAFRRHVYAPLVLANLFHGLAESAPGARR